MAFPYKAILLDFGGVFFYFNWMRFCNQLALGAPHHDGSQIKKMLDSGLLYAYETGTLSNDQFFSILKTATSFTHSQETFTNLLSDCEPLPQAIALVPQLAQRAPLIAVSNLNEVHARVINAYPNFTEHFTHFAYSCELGLHKPHPSYFAAVLDKIGCAPHEVLLVDDLLENLQGARAAGLEILQYRYPEDLKGLLDTNIAQYSSLGYT